MNRACDTFASMLPRNKIRIVCVLLFVASISVCLNAQQVVAHVLDVKGEWRLQGSSVLVTAGQSLTAGERIATTSNRPGDAITIVRDENMTRQRIICDATPASPCRNPINIEAPASAPEGQSQFRKMVQTALAVLLNKPPAIESHYALTLSRGHEAVLELESVVSMNTAQQIELPPAPSDWPSGHYTITVARPGTTALAPEQSVLLNSEGRWKPILIAAPGLYQVSIRNSDGAPVADEMLLAVSAAEYEARQATFQAMVANTTQWNGPNARADEHLFLRAFLLTECASC